MSEAKLALNVTYTTKPGMRESFLNAVRDRGILAKIHAEEGCLQYEYFLSVEELDKLLLVEAWTSAAALQAHSDGAAMQELIATQGEFILNVTVKRYQEA